MQERDTSKGVRGKAVQFCMTYTKIISLFQLMLRAVKLHNFKLYKHALIEIIPTHFMTNHRNYSRWISIYCLDLANLAT